MPSPNHATIHRCHHQAMATTFEIQIAHEDERYARQAAQAAFDEVDRLESVLSRYIENSDISQINRMAPGTFLRVNLDTFACLQWAQEMYEVTGHVFDISIGQMIDSYKAADRQNVTPIRTESAMDRLILRPEDMMVGVSGEGVDLDLGGIGKGFAVDFIAETLEEWGLAHALINGGYSTLRAWGTQPDGLPWQTALRHPADQKFLERIPLWQMAISGSGKEKGSHIIDPRNGQPAQNRLASWSQAPLAVVADCLSTAFMVMTDEEIEGLCRSHPAWGAMVLANETSTPCYFGNWQRGQES